MNNIGNIMGIILGIIIGIIMGILWEHHGDSMGISWE